MAGTVLTLGALVAVYATNGSKVRMSAKYFWIAPKEIR